jgi:tRNA(Ile)-lysidine synthase TilS/MesJ
MLELIEVRICRRCILPESFPGLRFNAAGECNLCQAASPVADLDEHCARLRVGMEAAIDAARGRGTYECIVAFSGGKDSSYVLKLLVETYRLRCLAVTIDNGFISDRARANGYAVTAALGVDLLVFRPAPQFMNTLYRESALRSDLHPPTATKRASSICTSCIGVINRQMRQLAVQFGAPVIAGGYIGGQVPKDSAVLHVDQATLERANALTREKAVASFGPEAERFFAVPASGAKVSIINPLLTVRVSEAAIIEALRPLGWQPTTDTGSNSTNCRLNELGILVHYRRHGFNPYVFEMAEQVRGGLLDRETALARARAIPDVEAVAPQAQQIGLDLRDLA